MDSNVRLTMVQLPGVNTPQFDWVRAHTKGKPRPVGAIYQPEVAARAIWKAAHSSRKQWIVGAPAYQAIEADKLASPLLDRYLARGNIEAQQGEPLPAGRKDNLFEPLDEREDRGAHGRFDDQSRTKSPLLWASENRGWIAAGAALALGSGAGHRTFGSEEERKNEWKRTSSAQHRENLRIIRSIRCSCPFPIVCFIMTLILDILYVRGDTGVAGATNWLLGVGLVMGALAAVAGLTDFLGDDRVRGLGDALKHMLANVTAVVLEVVNFVLRLKNPDFIGSTGVYISGVVVLILLYSGWKGGDLVFRHGVGVHDTSNL